MNTGIPLGTESTKILDLILEQANFPIDDTDSPYSLLIRLEKQYNPLTYDTKIEDHYFMQELVDAGVWDHSISQVPTRFVLATPRSMEARAFAIRSHLAAMRAQQQQQEQQSILAETHSTGCSPPSVQVQQLPRPTTAAAVSTTRSYIPTNFDPDNAQSMAASVYATHSNVPAVQVQQGQQSALESISPEREISRSPPQNRIYYLVQRETLLESASPEREISRSPPQNRIFYPVQCETLLETLTCEIRVLKAQIRILQPQFISLYGSVEKPNNCTRAVYDT